MRHTGPRSKLLCMNEKLATAPIACAIACAARFGSAALAERSGPLQPGATGPSRAMAEKVIDEVKALSSKISCLANVAAFHVNEEWKREDDGYSYLDYGNQIRRVPN